MSPKDQLAAILSAWKKDGSITPLNLQSGITDQPELFERYMNEYREANQLVFQLEQKLELTKSVRIKYFEGKMSKEEIDTRGWKYDPFEGEKVLKAEIKKRVEIDDEVLSVKANLKEAEILKGAIRDILDQIKFRTQTIKTMMDIIKFQRGD